MLWCSVEVTSYKRKLSTGSLFLFQVYLKEWIVGNITWQWRITVLVVNHFFRRFVFNWMLFHSDWTTLLFFRLWKKTCCLSFYWRPLVVCSPPSSSLFAYTSRHFLQSGQCVRQITAGSNRPSLSEAEQCRVWPLFRCSEEEIKAFDEESPRALLGHSPTVTHECVHVYDYLCVWCYLCGAGV